MYDTPAFYATALFAVFAVYFVLGYLICSILTYDGDGHIPSLECLGESPTRIKIRKSPGRGDTGMEPPAKRRRIYSTRPHTRGLGYATTADS